KEMWNKSLRINCDTGFSLWLIFSPAKTLSWMVGTSSPYRVTTADIRLAKMRCATRTYWTKVLYAGPRNLRKCLREFSLADEIISKTTANVERTKNMKQIVSFQMISALALLALTAGCATTQSSTQNKESMLAASGFKVITP